jgi:hypothetical protein
MFRRATGYLKGSLPSMLLSVAAVAAPSLLRDSAWVEQRVREWQPTARERRWEQIGWARDIRHALAVARQTNRPVFLFTLDGRMGVGRC